MLTEFKAGRYDDVLDMIGNTPIVRLKNLDTGPCELYVKLEHLNPGGSIKDRIALFMIEQAERDGKIKRGTTLVEATAGNTGLGLALVAAQKGYRLLLVMPDKMSQEKIFHLKAMGAEVIMTRSDVSKGHPDYYQDKAARIVSEMDNAYYINQFANPANSLAHERTTGPEIWLQMAGNVDAVVCGGGSCGTITGLSRYFGHQAPSLEMVLADPEGSILKHYIETGEILNKSGSWLVEGIGEDFIPPIADFSRVKKGYTIPDAEAFHVCREILRKEGLMIGSSSGTLIAAALRYCREQTHCKRVVTFVCDSGNKYLSKVYNDYWMLDQGFIQREKAGDLRDLVMRRHEEHATVTVGIDEPLMSAHKRMKLYDMSQLPVLDGKEIVGIIDEEDILIRVLEEPNAFNKPVKIAMSQQLVTLTPDQSIDALKPIFEKGMVAIIKDSKRFYGLVTRIDLLNYLRRQLN